MATVLQHLLRFPTRRVEFHDVSAAFLRLARTQWGESVPCEPQRFARGILSVACASPLWRAELLDHTEELWSALEDALPSLTLRRIRVTLR